MLDMYKRIIVRKTNSQGNETLNLILFTSGFSTGKEDVA